jgi:hypothetical protein
MQGRIRHRQAADGLWQKTMYEPSFLSKVWQYAHRSTLIGDNAE